MHLLYTHALCSIPINYRDLSIGLTLLSLYSPSTLTILNRDLSIDCNGLYHQGMKVYATIMIIVIPIGVPLFYFRWGAMYT